MPIPIPRPSSGQNLRPVDASPYYLRQHQDWAVRQERMRHNGALYQVGEWVVLFLMWTVIDFEQGLVRRCPTCFRSGDGIDDRVTSVYKQPTRRRCPNCFGTTFEGGFRARIVRPAILTDADETEQVQKRGASHPSRLQVETTVDFRTRPGDYLVRADNTRWQLSAPQRTTLRTGFEHPDQGRTGISYGSLSASFEEPGQVVYTLPPVEDPDIAAVLGQPVSHLPDFRGFELLRAPALVPGYVR